MRSKAASMTMDLSARVIVREVDDSGEAQIAKVEDEAPTDDGDEDLVEVEVVHPYGFSSRAPAGAEGVTVAPSADSAQQVAIAAVQRGARPKDLAEGEVVLHFLGAVKVFLGSDGITYVGAGDATESMVLGDALKSWLEQLTVPTPFGPSGTPINAPALPTVLSTITKVA